MTSPPAVMRIVLIFFALAFIATVYGANPPTHSFDCASREFAYEYAQKLQPWRSNLQDVFDALQLSTLCNVTFIPKRSNPRPPLASLPLAATEYYLDASKGSDSNPGTLQKPFKTLEHGVEVSRKASGAKILYLRAGTFRLSDTLRLTAADSQLSIVAYKGEAVEISGGLPLVVKWEPYEVSDKNMTLYPNINNVWGRAHSRQDTDTIKYLGDFDTLQPCQDACVNYDVNGLTCHSFTWHSPDLNNDWAKQCFAVVDNSWDPHQDNLHTSGRLESWNIYVADLSGQNIPEIMSLRIGGKRGNLARHPNADTEVAQFPTGWITKADKWDKPRDYGPITYKEISDPKRSEMSMFQTYRVGTGGPCSIYTPPESYWCSEHPEGGGAFQFRVPSGMTYPAGALPAWKNGTGALVHVWRPGHWEVWMFEVDSDEPASRHVSWHLGGFQGARGNDNGNEFYMSNVFEFLDSPNEFFYDRATQKLYHWYNATGAPPADLAYEAAPLKTLLEVNATQDTPVKGLTLQGLRFTNSAPTFMDPHGVPSGGDWGLQRMGAVFLEGTENTTIDNCVFERLDGNALFVSGYNRYCTVQNSEFLWIGDSAMAAWGYTQDLDGTDGNQPRFTSVLNNFVHEIGHYQKQSSAWFQAKTCQTLIKGNIFFNGPRAGININDGFGGGNEIAENLVFNECRESSDHGPFNSWDRQPFLTKVNNGTPSLDPAYNDFHNNFMIANYGSNWCWDNDDGSCWYKLHDNFEVLGRHKSDFAGHNKFTYNSVNAYPENNQCAVFNGVNPGFQDGYWNNSCVQNADVAYASFPGNHNNPDPTTLPIMHDNNIYNKDAKTSVSVGDVKVNEEDWQKKGQDQGTTAHPLPTDDEIISWGRALLGL